MELETCLQLFLQLCKPVLAYKSSVLSPRGKNKGPKHCMGSSLQPTLLPFLCDELITLDSQRSTVTAGQEPLGFL